MRARVEKLAKKLESSEFNSEDTGFDFVFSPLRANNQTFKDGFDTAEPHSPEKIIEKQIQKECPVENLDNYEKNSEKTLDQDEDVASEASEEIEKAADFGKKKEVGKRLKSDFFSNSAFEDAFSNHVKPKSENQNDGMFYNPGFEAAF